MAFFPNNFIPSRDCRLTSLRLILSTALSLTELEETLGVLIRILRNTKIQLDQKNEIQHLLSKTSRVIIAILNGLQLYGDNNLWNISKVNDKNYWKETNGTVPDLLNLR